MDKLKTLRKLEELRDLVNQQKGFHSKADFLGWAARIEPLLAFNALYQANFQLDLEMIHANLSSQTAEPLANRMRTTLIQAIEQLKHELDTADQHQGVKMSNSSFEDDYSNLQMLIAQVQSLMVAYVTGQQHPKHSGRYEEVYKELESLFLKLGLSNPNPHRTLQEFDGFCRLRHLDHYSQRSDYVGNLYQNVLNNLFESDDYGKSSKNVEINKKIEEPKLMANPKKVFVVHGRNSRLNTDFFSFLRALHLEPIEWSAAISSTGEASPYIGDVLSSALSQAQAIVILMTPDDLVVLKKPFYRDDDEAYEKTLFGQARPNVLFEAGLAFGRNPKRTVIVKVGQLKPFSDIHGRHVVHLDNSAERRQEVANRLRTAGCDVNTEGSIWLKVGFFQILPEEEENVSGSNEETKNELTLSADIDIPDLSKEAQQLLIEATRDEHGTILKISKFGGQSVSTNGKSFGIEGDRRSEAAWEAAINGLLYKGLIRREGYKGGFVITQEGYRVADLLSKTAEKSSNNELKT